VVWIISDGKAGHELQMLGVAQALGAETQVKRVSPTGLFKLAAPWGPVAPSARFGKARSAFSPPWPDIALATGRLTTPYIRALKRKAGLRTFTVILLDPKVSAATADLFWVPEHDTRRGANVMTTLTSPHRYSPARIAELRQTVPPVIAALPTPRIAVLIGGPNGVYTYSDADIRRLADALGSLAASGAGLMITPSRRTPPALLAAIEGATHGARRILWDGTGDNPYPDFLAHADAFLVTADSVNMAGEAAATGKPIHIFTPSGGSPKFARFHAALERCGATRPLTERGCSENWTYTPLDSARVIADEIVRRMEIRSRLLPGLVSRNDK
jgi:mitochondrial fission protein ELM1